MISAIRVEMLGGLSVCADNKLVFDSGGKLNKPWQLFCYLVLNKSSTNTMPRIMDAVWAGEEFDDPGNVLKNTIYALRREFRGANNTSESPILFENGGYICNPAVKIELDTDEFEKIVLKARKAKEEEKIPLLRKAADLYKGEVLPQLSDEAWVITPAMRCRKYFLESAGTLCKYLESRQQYNELLAVSTSAHLAEPLEDDFYLYAFRALYQLKMYRAIIPAYNKAVRIFSQELGAAPNQELQDIYAKATDKIDTIQQDILVIRQELEEIAKDLPTSGPMFCSYDVFKYLYQMIARASERSGQRVSVLLITLNGKEGQPIPAAHTISKAMGQVKALLLSGILRKSDTVARYSRSQFIVMLNVEKVGATQKVVKRIQQGALPCLNTLHMQLVFASTEMDPIALKI